MHGRTEGQTAQPYFKNLSDLYYGNPEGLFEFLGELPGFTVVSSQQLISLWIVDKTFLCRIPMEFSPGLQRDIGN